jgi:hypothetical protein
MIVDINERCCMEFFKLRFWEHVKKRLEDESNLYFFGGTLCVDHEEKAGGIALNLDGSGFVYSNPYPFFKKWSGKFYPPQEIIELVRMIYLKTKGETQHYLDEVNDDKRSENTNQKVCTTC